MSEEARGEAASALLLALARARRGRRLTLGEIAAGLGGRSFGLLLLALALPAWIPVLPPGVPSVFGLAIALLALQMALRRPRPWLPGVVARRGLAAARLERALLRARPWLQRLEGLCRERQRWLFEGPAAVLLALWLLLLALALMVPLPMTNSGPAAAIALTALGLVERDGLVVLGGVLLGLLGLAAIALFWGGAWLGLQWLLGG